jgi:hypothetical protein
MKSRFFVILLSLSGAAAALNAQINPAPLVVTASNATQNQLLVYNSSGKLLQTIFT